MVRGHSRYLWDAEHYLDANFYGRYLGYGSMQVLTAQPGERVTFTTSGWQENGFDWNRIPGATSIHLPFDQLRAKVLNVDVFPEWKKCCILMRHLPEGFLKNVRMETLV